MYRSIHLAIIIVWLFGSSALAEPGDIIWGNWYNDYGKQYAYSMELTKDDGAIIAGFMWETMGYTGCNIYIVKTDAEGNVEFNKEIGERWDYELANCIAKTEGGYIITGLYDGYISFIQELLLMKIDSNGNKEWSRTYCDNTAEGNSVSVTDDGGYIITGSSVVGDNSEMALLKTNSYGDSLWSAAYGREGNDAGYSIRILEDKGFIIAGSIQSSGREDLDFYVVRTDSVGNLIWENSYGGTGDEIAYCIQLSEDGGYAMTGSTTSFGAGGTDIYVVKIDSLGNIEWDETYGTTGEDLGYYLERAFPEGYIISGYVSSNSIDAYLVRIDQMGNVIWSRNYGGWNKDRGRSVRQTSDRNFLLAGTTYSFGNGEADFYLLKIEGEYGYEFCCEISMQYDDPIIVPPGGSFDYRGILVNPNEEPVVTDVWAGVKYDGEFYQTLNFVGNEPLQPSQFITRNITQNIPYYAPPGEYTYIAYTGEYPLPCDSFWFDFTVTNEPLHNGSDDWNIYEYSDYSMPTAHSIDAYPNPFNAQSIINYALPQACKVELSVYNLLGQRVETLVNTQQPAGYHSITWDASQYASGIYFYKLNVGDRQFVKRMMLIK
ncbi:MAG: T9SS type A sorting domain-containing protein [candidate division Zixibacteria bacterium]|nr:T9SS type A sorting domain-containing protein [candidate division Zixibacteria bacterium]